MSPLPKALPFWLSLCLPPLALIGMTQGGWTIALLPLSTWWLFTLLDAITGHNTDNPDPSTPDAALQAYRMVTLIWFPIQIALLAAMLWYIPRAAHLDASPARGTLIPRHEFRPADLPTVMRKAWDLARATLEP